MPLELSKIVDQIEDMGRELAGRARRQQKALPAARAVLRQFADKQGELCRVADSEAGRRWRCASPGDEPLDEAFPVPHMPEQVSLVATDGSQIYPDRHGLAFYYLINTGSVVFRHGSGHAPTVATAPRLCYLEDQVYPAGNPVTSDLVSAERDLAEIQTLADLVLAEATAGEPCLGLADGSLLIWLRRGAIPEGQQTRLLADYLSCLDRLRAQGLPLLGFVSRPQSAEVLALLYLAHLEPGAVEPAGGLAETGYRGLTDRALFGTLQPGERSALFARGTADNQDFRARGHAIYFFYLNTGSDLARVEVPEWVVRRPEQLSLAHAAVYEQCRFNSGYPYVLTRADEQAVILGEEREALESMLMQAMAQQGLAWPELSRKAQQKRVARWRRPR